ncbi:MAG: DUF3124 domain-containing protein [Desulfobacteraceae bacterium]|nr:DUF3124 domain-containing protein [Desulfobacteraceae bacterium]
MEKKYIWRVLIIFFIFGIAFQVQAKDCKDLSEGQTLYVPVYSHIYIGNKANPYLLTVTLSIRNINPLHPITLSVVDYYGTQGKLIKHYLDKPLSLPPLASTRYIILSKDKEGGSGANFIVNWSSKKPVNPPIVESIMIGTQSQQGISFTSRGQVIVQIKP